MLTFFNIAIPIACLCLTVSCFGIYIKAVFKGHDTLLLNSILSILAMINSLIVVFFMYNMIMGDNIYLSAYELFGMIF